MYIKINGKSMASYGLSNKLSLEQKKYETNKRQKDLNQNKARFKDLHFLSDFCYYF